MKYLNGKSVKVRIEKMKKCGEINGDAIKSSDTSIMEDIKSMIGELITISFILSFMMFLLIVVIFFK